MYAAWQSYGLWALLGVTNAVTAALFAIAGWRAQNVHMWHQRGKPHRKIAREHTLVKVKAAGVVAVGAFLAWAWLVY